MTAPAAVAMVSGWPTSVGLGTLLHVILFLPVALHCLTHPRHASSAILWLYTAWAFPFFGPLAYAAFGVSRLPRKAWRKQHADRRFGETRAAREREAQPLAYWRSLRASLAGQPGYARGFDQVLNRLTPHHPLLGGNAVEMLLDGTETYPALLDAIRSARHHIHLCFYIIGRDQIARAVLDACAERAREGVQVRVLFDEFGSAVASLTRFFRHYRWVPNMRVVGFSQVDLFKKRLQINLRNHRKIAVIDGLIAFTGGINLHRGHVASQGSPAIRDYHFEIRGPLVNELQYTFLQDWYSMTEENPEDLLSDAYFCCRDAVGAVAARVVNSGPSSAEHSLEDLFFNALGEARKAVLAVTPYLVLTEPLLHAFRMTALRGVHVRLVVPGNNNHRSVQYAARSQYGPLLEAGVRIFERRGPLLHAKAMVIDDALSIVGTANLDVRSLRLNYETSVISYDAALAARLLREIRIEIEHSDEIDPNAWAVRPWRRRVLENAFALATPVL